MNTFPDLDDRLSQVEALVAASPDEPTFARELVRIVAAATAASGVQLWNPDGDGRPQVVQEAFLSAEGAAAAATCRGAFQTAIARANSERSPLVLLPHSGAAHAANPSPFHWLLCPIQRAGEVYGAIVIWLDADWEPQSVERVSEIANSCAQLAAGFFEQLQLLALRDDVQFWSRASSLIERLHSQVSLEEVAYAGANGIRMLLECDRVWVLLCRGSTCRVLAVSGVQQPDNRSNQVRALTRLGAALSLARLPFSWSRGTPLSQAPSLRLLANAYLDVSHLAELKAVPLLGPTEGKSPPLCLGMLFVERFTGEAGVRGSGFGVQEVKGAILTESPDQISQISNPDSQIPNPKSALLASHLAIALQNARDWQLAPVARRLRMWRRRVSSRRWIKWVLGLSAAGVMAATLLLVPADFTVEARGELQPARRQQVFAAEDGIVNRLLVKTGERVRSGQPLLRLRSLDLEQEQQRISGEWNTALRRIASLEAARLDFESNPDRPAAQRMQVTAELEELRVTERSLEQQKAILSRRMAALEIGSPLAGQVQTWDVEQLLSGRPVRRGQQLLTVADVEGPWQVELQVPDSRTGDVLEARAKLDPVRIEFSLATDPGAAFRGQLVRLAQSTETHDTEIGPAVRADVSFDRSQVRDLRSGAKVIARIHCGRKPLGYVWFIDLWRALRRWMF